MSQKVSGIYFIAHKDSLRFYVGSSANTYKRWSRHRSELNKGIHRNPKLQNAWNKYGEDAFDFQIVELCDKENLILREQFWLDDTRCVDLGYNVSRSALSPMSGRKHSLETRAKLSVAGKGRKQSPEHRAKMSESQKGRIFSPEHRKKISETRKMSESQKKKLKSLKGEK